MGTKKGGARKGKPKGSRLGFDDTRAETKKEMVARAKKEKAGRAGIVKMGGKKPKKSWGEAREKAKSLKKSGFKMSWDRAILKLTTGGYTPEQAIDILVRVLK